MGRYFSTEGYPGIKSNADVTEGINSLGDALTDVLNRRQKKQQFDQELQFQQADAQRKSDQSQGNQDYQNRIIDQRETRDQRDFSQRQSEMERKASIDAAKALADNNPELAKTMLHNTVSYDPATGRETGRGELVPGPMADVGPQPQAPLEPQAPAGVPPEIAARRRGRTSTSVDENDIYQRQGAPMPPQTGVDPTESFGRPKNFIPTGLTLTSDDGPVEPGLGGPPASPAPTSVESRGFSPDVQSSREQATKDMMTEEQAKMDQAAYAPQKTAFDAASAAYPDARARYDASRTTAERDRSYTIRFGANDPGVSIAPARQREQQRQESADRFVESLHGMSLSPRDQQAADAAHRAILAGEDPSKVYKAFDAHMVLGQTQDFKHGEGLLRDQAAKERALIAGPRNPGDFHVGQLHESQEGGTVRDQKAWLDDFKDFESKAGQIPLQGKSYPRLVQAVKNMNSDNGPLQRDAQSQLVSYFSGGGVVRKFEQEFLLSHLAGLGAQGETAIEHLHSGKLGATDLAVMKQATMRALQEQRDRAEELGTAIQRGFGPGTGHDYFGGNIDAKARMTLGAIGYDMPPMYPGAEPVQLGDIARPYRSQLHGRGQAPPPAPAPSPVRPPGAPPEIKARDKAKKNGAVDDALGALGG